MKGLLLKDFYMAKKHLRAWIFMMVFYFCVLLDDEAGKFVHIEIKHFKPHFVQEGIDLEISQGHDALAPRIYEGGWRRAPGGVYENVPYTAFLCGSDSPLPLRGIPPRKRGGEGLCAKLQFTDPWI